MRDERQELIWRTHDPSFLDEQKAFAQQPALLPCEGWDLSTWFDTRLDEAARARIDIAHRTALEAARVAMRKQPDAAGVALGLPPPARRDACSIRQ